MLVGREPAERLGYAVRAEPAYPGVALRHELADALSVPRMEGLLLEQAEEALGAGVVAARPLAGHAAGEYCA